MLITYGLSPFTRPGSVDCGVNLSAPLEKVLLSFLLICIMDLGSFVIAVPVTN